MSTFDLAYSPTPYDPPLFVNREKELNGIAERVRSAQSDRAIGEPVINFWGVGGTGKSWLLRHIQQMYAFSVRSDEVLHVKRPTFALLYVFAERNPGITLIHDIVSYFGVQLLQQIPSDLLSSSERSDLHSSAQDADIDAFVQALLNLSHRFVPLILIDNAELIDEIDWEGLERLLIEPLVRTGRILFVVAGRRRVPHWKRFEVRRRAMESDKSRIRPFGKEEVEKQIKQRHLPIPIDLLFPYTAGNPGIVENVAQHITAWMEGVKPVKPQVLDQAWFDQHQQDFLEILRHAEERILGDIDVSLRRILDAVSALRFYRLEALRFMLISQDEPRMGQYEQADGYYLHLLRSLEQNTEVVWWERERRAYITSEDIRQLANRRRLLENHQEYLAHQQRALAMYWQWVEEYPQVSEDFILEIWFHLACIYLADQDRNKLEVEVERVVDFAHNKLKPERLLILQKQLDGDRELLDLLPDDVSEGLKAHLLQFLE